MRSQALVAFNFFHINIRQTPIYFPGTNLPVVAALAVIIGVCAVGISYMAWQKKPRKTARQYKPLYVNQPNRFGKL